MSGRRTGRSGRLTRLGIAVLCAVLTACTAEGGARVAASTPVPDPARPHRGQAAPDQRWGSAAGQEHVVRGNRNTEVPPSQRGRYPLRKPGEPAKARPNVASVVAPPAATPAPFDAAASTELPGERDAHQRTYTNADGTLTTEFSAVPMNYRRADGSWAPIDPTLVPAADAAAGWRSRANRLDVRLAARADAPELVRLAFDDRHVFGYGLAGARPVAGSVSGTTATYRGVLPDVDLELQAQAGAVKETLVLHSAEAAHRFRFPLRLTGLTAALDGDRIVLTDGAGARRAIIPAGYMVDAKDASTGGVTYHLVGTGADQAIEVGVDAAWLREPGRAFPVRVDPSVQDGDADSAMVVQGDSSRSGASELVVGKEGGRSAASYLKFDKLVQRLTNHTIYGAQLQVVNYDSASCKPRPVSVHPVTGSWTAGTGFSYPGPAVGAALATESFAYGHVALGQSATGCPVKGTLFDLGVKGRDLVQGWVTGKPNNGLSLRAPVNDGTAWKRFTGPGTENPPRLYVTHSPYNAGYAIPQPVPEPAVLQNRAGKVKITVTNLSAQAWAPGSYYLAYRAYNVTTGAAAGQHRSADLPATVARNGRVTLDATVHPLPPGQYFLDFTMVRSGGPVFTDQHVPPARIMLEVFDVPPVLDELHPPNGYQIATLTPQLWARATDLDAPPGSALQYKFEYCERDAAGARVNCADSGFLAQHAWTVPTGKLAWSKAYEWRTVVKDRNNEIFSDWQTLLSSVPQPEITSRIANAPYGSQERDFDPQVGNLSTAAVDASVTNVGPPLRVVRTYNSLDPRRDLMFGAGWMTQFDMRLVPDNDGSGNVVITYPDGQQVRFGRNPDGTFAAPVGRTAQLTMVDNGYRLLDRAGTSYLFSGAGRLSKISDAMGRSIVLEYNPATGKLAKAQVAYAPGATFGRYLTFGWTGNRVTSVSTSPVAGRVLTFSYSYTGDLLSRACSPDPAICTTYTYSAGSHYRSAVLDSGPESYWRLGEAEGTAAGSEIANNLGKDAGKAQNVTLGVPGALGGTGNTAATFNGTTATIGLPNSAIKRNRDGAVELWFKVSQSQTGGPLLGYQDKALEEATSGVPLLYVGTDGRLRGQFRTAAINPITGIRDLRDNAWHHVVLSAMGNTQTLYLDGAVVGTLDGALDHTAMTVNQVGAAYASSPASWPGWGPTARRHFSGSIDEVAFYAHPLGEQSVRAHRALAAPADHLASVVLPSGKVSSEAVYDTNLDRIKEFTDGNGGTWKIGAPLVHGGDADLRRTIRVLDPADRPYLYEYDALAGRMLRSGSPLGLATRAEDRPGYHTPAPTPKPSPTEVCTSPDPNDERFCTVIPGTAQGPVFEQHTLEGMIIRSFGYNEKGFQNKITNENGDTLTSEFDNRGNVTSRRTCRTATQCHTTYTTFPATVTNPFDPRNDLPVETRDARSTSATDNTFRTQYTYNKAGDLESQTGADGHKLRHTYTDGSQRAIGGSTAPMPPGLVLSTTDPRGAVTEYGYNHHGDLALVITPSGLKTEFSYDDLGRRTAEKEISDSYPAGVVTTYTYDDLNRVVSTTAPVTTDAISGVRRQLVTTTTYDVDSNVTKVEERDAFSPDPPRVTTTEYDEFNRPVKSTDAEDNEETRGFDRFGNRTWVVDANGNRYEYAYTARNTIAEVRLRDWQGDPQDGGAPPPVAGYVVLKSFAYDYAGRMARQTDSMGRRTEYTYYKDDLLHKVVLKDFRDPDGSTRDYVLETNEYDAAGNLTRKVSGNGKMITENKIDKMGRPEYTLSDPNGIARRTTFTYDQGGNVLRTAQSGWASNVPWPVLASSRVVENVYDRAGRRTHEKVVAADRALVTSYTFDQRGLPLTATSPRGNVTGADRAAFTTTYRHDELGQRVSVVAPTVKAESNGGPAEDVTPTVTTGYDAFGQAVAARDALGNISRTTYDRLGRPTASMAPSYTPVGGVPITPTTRTTYDAVGNVKETVSPRGAVTRYTYDRLNRVLVRDEPARTNDERALWRYTYTRTGDVLSVTSPTGARTETTYDDLDRPVTTTQIERYPVADAFTTRHRYDDVGNLVETVSPSGATTTMNYDGLGQATSMVSPGGVVTRTGYDPYGSQVRVTDGVGRTIRTDYDGLGRIHAKSDLDATDKVLRTERFETDEDGHVIARTNGLQQRTTFDFDAMSRLVRQVEPKDAGTKITTSFGYDAAGNRTRYTDGRGNNTIYTVNSLGLPESVIEPSTPAHPAPADRTWTVSYNAQGQAERLTAPGAVVRSRGHDAAGRLETETGSGAAAASRQLRYDLAGRPISVNAPGGANTYSYNDRGGLLTATGPSGNASYVYNQDGQLTERTDAAGTATFGYERGRLKTQKDGVARVTQTLDYDRAGQLSTVDYGAGRVRTYTYDDLGRLSSDVLRNAEKAEVSKIAYEYDADDHLKVKETAGTALPGRNTYDYDHAGRLVSWTSPKGTVNYDWDDSGNRIRAGDKTATYDARNRLLSDGDYTYAYTPRGTLASRTSSGLEDKFSFDAFDRLVDQDSQTYTYDGLDRMATRNGVPFTYAGTGTDVIGDGTESYGRGASGELLAVAAGDEKRIALTDEHDDLVGNFDAGNTDLKGLDDSAAYEPFGQVLGSIGAQSRLGFQGDWTDPDTQQVNMGARWYNPGTGTFNSRDSVNYSSGASILANRYAYGAGDPLANTDPDGHWSCSLCKRVGNAISSVGSAIISGYRAFANTTIGGYVDRGVRAAWGYGKSFVSAAWSGVKTVVNVLATPVKAGYKALTNGYNYMSNGFSNVYNKYAKPYVDRGKDFVRQKAQEIQRQAVAVRDKAKAAITYVAKHTPVGRIAAAALPVIAGLGKLVVTAVTKPAALVSTFQNVVNDTSKAVTTIYNEAIAARDAVVGGLSDALDATGKWVSEHKAEIAGFAAGALVGVGCGVAVGWTGLGAVGCAALAGAVGSVVTDMVGGGKGWKEMTANAFFGATAGAILGPLSSVAGSATGAGIRALMGGAGRQALSAAGSAGAQTLRGFGSTQLGGLVGRAGANPAAASAGRQAAPDGCNSFVPATPVLMADGSTKRIEDVRVGDLVLATDPTTGRTEKRKVTHLIVGKGEKKLVELTIDVDGAAGHRTGKLTATAGHPFWVPRLNKWVDAAKVRVGAMLQTSAGTYVKVTGVKRWTAQHQRAHNLTVDGIHTYFVAAGGTSVLVHNCPVLGSRGPVGSFEPTVEIHKPQGPWTVESRVSDGNALRDAAGMPQTTGRLRTWTSAINIRSGEIAVACSGGGNCAETNILQRTGWGVGDILFNRAAAYQKTEKGLVWDEKPICLACQSIIPYENVVSGALFARD